VGKTIQANSGYVVICNRVVATGLNIFLGGQPKFIGAAGSTCEESGEVEDCQTFICTSWYIRTYLQTPGFAYLKITCLPIPHFSLRLLNSKKSI